MCSVIDQMIIMYAVKIVFMAYLIVIQCTLVLLLIFAVINHCVIYLMEHFLHHHLVSSDVDISSASNFLQFFSSNNRQS